MLTKTSSLSNLYRLPPQQRLQVLREAGWLTEDDVEHLEDTAPAAMLAMADRCVENQLGVLAMPLGLATHFVIDGVERVIPLAVEETSIIAGLCKTAKWVQQKGGSITTRGERLQVIGQLHIQAADPEEVERCVTEKREAWSSAIDEGLCANMVKRGGGMRGLTHKRLDLGASGQIVIVEVTLDACDAMGANLVTQVAEQVGRWLLAEVPCEVEFAIVSNYATASMVSAQVTVPDVDEVEAEKIVRATAIADNDMYRAVTHNKGIMNGIDALLIATGNDWRAVEASCHAHAARDGCYRSLSTWRYEGGMLVGELSLPINLGIIGGVTAIHPTVQRVLRWLSVDSAAELARIAVAVGLCQNLAALRALIGEGISQGHMRLHLDNLMLAAEIPAEHQDQFRVLLEQHLRERGSITSSHVQQIYARWEVEGRRGGEDG